MVKARLQDSADFVIVGTGAGGATAARVLAEAGLSVIMVEEGPHLDTRQRPEKLLDAMSQSMRDFGTTSTSSVAPIVLLQGRCVGGSTAVNSGIVWRMPDDVREDWSSRSGLGELVAARPLERAFEQIERELGVGETPEEIRGGNGELMRLASEQMGLCGRATRRNAKHCQGSARCLQGCPNAARQSMDVSYVPHAMANGATLYSGCRAERVLFVGGRAVGVRGRCVGGEHAPAGARFELRARRGVILAAGALFSPLILSASGLSHLVGEGFAAHPAISMIGRFDHSVGMGFGATQSWEVPLRERGYKLESISLPPELTASRLPGTGERWEERIMNMDRCAQWAAIVRMQARGRVRRGLFGGVRVRYEPLPSDIERLKEALSLLVRMFFAAGAREVYPGIAHLPQVFDRPEQAELIRDPRIGRRDFHLMASHHFGGAVASADPRHGVVGPTLRCHDAEGLYVMDASAFPTNLGVNPQHSIMAVAWRGAEQLANAHTTRTKAA